MGCNPKREDEPVAFSQDAWSFEGREAVRFQTDHFDIYTTLRDTQFAQALPGFLETSFAQYNSLLPAPIDKKRRLQTYVFDTRRQWESFTRQRFPQRFPVYRQISAGGFAEGNLCVVYYLRRMYTLSVLAHEGMHQYFANFFDVKLPAWVNEGLATYCESYELAGDRPVFTPKRNTFRLNALREALSVGSIIPLKEMLATDAGQVIVRGRSQVTKTYYAQAWAMLVYIRHGEGGKYSAGFDELMKGIVSGDMPLIAQAAKIRAPEPANTSYGEAVFRAYITDDLQAFDHGFQAYLYKLAGFRPAQ